MANKTITYLLNCGGEAGIRTLGGLITHAGFQDRCIQPALPPPHCGRFAWRRHPDSNRGSGLCRPVPYHLAMPPYMVPEAGLEPARRKPPRDFKSLASTNSATRAWSGRRDSNPRPQPWQGCALPLSYSRKILD